MHIADVGITSIIDYQLSFVVTRNCLSYSHIRDIRKVGKRRHQYLEFGHTQGENFKKPCQKVH